MTAWYVVVCRAPFDEEDSLYIIEAATEAEAVEQAKAERLELRGGDKEEETDDDGDEKFFLNYVVRCETKPEIVIVNV